MKFKHGILLCVFIMLAGLFIFWQPASAGRGTIYTTEPRTLEFGKQGLHISSVPYHVRLVEIEKIKPPLAAKYTLGVDIAYRGPALDITFMNEKEAPITPNGILASVYFNISEPEVRMWTEGGSNEIAIWYYNKESEEWQMCPTRRIAEKINNGKYDRLACFVMGNGIYVLGKMEFDPVFPLWFKPYDKGVQNNNLMVVQDY